MNKSQNFSDVDNKEKITLKRKISSQTAADQFSESQASVQRLMKEETEEREHAAFELERERKKAVKKKPRLSPSQDQDALVTACEEGNAAEVRRLLNKGAGANTLNSKGIHPLGAAVWGMNPEVVDTLLGEMKEESSLTWEECEAHNIGHYKEVFMFNEFAPQTFKDWNELLLKMNGSPFLAGLHLAEARKACGYSYAPAWANFRSRIERECADRWSRMPYQEQKHGITIANTREKLSGLRAELEQRIHHAAVRARHNEIHRTLTEAFVSTPLITLVQEYDNDFRSSIR